MPLVSILGIKISFFYKIELLFFAFMYHIRINMFIELCDTVKKWIIELVEKSIGQFHIIYQNYLYNDRYKSLQMSTKNKLEKDDENDLFLLDY